MFNPRRRLKRCFRRRAIQNICVTLPYENCMAMGSMCCSVIAVTTRPGSAIVMATWTVQNTAFLSLVEKLRIYPILSQRAQSRVSTVATVAPPLTTSQSSPPPWYTPSVSNQLAHPRTVSVYRRPLQSLTIKRIGPARAWACAQAVLNVTLQCNGNKRGRHELHTTQKMSL